MDIHQKVGIIVIKAAKDKWLFDLFFSLDDENLILLCLYKRDFCLEFTLNPNKEEIEYCIESVDNTEGEDGILTIEECVLKIDEYREKLKIETMGENNHEN